MSCATPHHQEQPHSSQATLEAQDEGVEVKPTITFIPYPGAQPRAFTSMDGEVSSNDSVQILQDGTGNYYFILPKGDIEATIYIEARSYDMAKVITINSNTKRIEIK